MCTKSMIVTLSREISYLEQSTIRRIVDCSIVYGIVYTNVIVYGIVYTNVLGTFKIEMCTIHMILKHMKISLNL